MGFWRVTYENVEKKHFITNISIYIYMVIDNLKFDEVLFCTYCKGLFCPSKQFCPSIILLFLRI